MNRKTLLLTLLVALLLTPLMTGCSHHMQAVPQDRIFTAPEAGKSVVIFMRPGSFAGAIGSSVFEVSGEEPSLVGLVAAKKKVAYQVEPGEHLFMVVGESADFMSAQLEPNKTYYAFVEPRLGAWKARFSLRPIHADEVKTSRFRSWVNSCRWVEKAPSADNWAQANMRDIKAKKRNYYKRWMDKDVSNRPRLLPQDGK